MADQLFYGKLSRVAPKGNGSNGYIWLNVEATQGDSTVYWRSDVPGKAGLDRVEVGQSVAIGPDFASTIVSLSSDKQQIVLADSYPDASIVDIIARIDPPPGEYYIASASFFDPSGDLTVANITGEYRSSGAPSDIIYAISAPAYDVANNKPLRGVFHRYYVYENLGYNLADSTVDLYVKWSEPGTEADSGHKMVGTTNQVVPIYALSNTQSLGPIFDTTISGLRDLEGTIGSSTSNYQIDLVNFYDQISGSASTGSFLVTGSAAGNILTLVKSDGESFDIQLSTDSVLQGAYSLEFTGSVLEAASAAAAKFNIDGTSIENSTVVSVHTEDYNSIDKAAYFARLTTGSLIKFTNFDTGNYYAKEIVGITSSLTTKYFTFGLARGSIYGPVPSVPAVPGERYDISFEGFGTSSSGGIGYIPTSTGSFVVTGSVYKGSASSTITLIQGAPSTSFDLEIFPFPYTGSARILGSLDVTGSVEIEGEFGESPFIVTLPHYAKNPKPLEVDSRGILILGSASGAPPQAKAGGILYSGSEYFLGFV